MALPRTTVLASRPAPAPTPASATHSEPSGAKARPRGPFSPLAQTVATWSTAAAGSAASAIERAAQARRKTVFMGPPGRDNPI